MNYGVGHRRGSDLALLWHRPVATAPTGPLTWEAPYATGAALKKKKERKKKNKGQKQTNKQKNQSGTAASCGIGRRCASDLALLWLWHKLIGAALI